jgi:Fur family transcriptional regulator, ferric uptake regulator
LYQFQGSGGNSTPFGENCPEWYTGGRGVPASYLLLEKNMPITPAAILAVFDEVGLRNTRPRRLIAERLAALAASGVVFTMDDLWHNLQQIDERLGRATVYRTIETLAARGLLDRVEFADGTHCYRVCGTSHHHHLTCTQCHRVVEVEACLPADQFASIARQNGFALEGHSLELFGRCPRCQAGQQGAGGV